MIKWRRLCGLTLVVLVGLAGLGSGVLAADFPTKSITYIIPFDPGGQSDIDARRQQPLLEQILQVPIVVTYKPGGGGSAGWIELVQSKPDGYTIAGINIPHIILQPLQRKNAGYKTEDLEPLCLFQKTPIGLAVLKSSPFQTLEDFISYAHAHPGAITLAGSGTYTGHHIAYLQLEKLTGAKFTYIPFTGAAPQVTAFLGGHATALLGNSNDLVQHQDRIRVLAIGSDERFPLLPDVPTFKELGYDMAPSIDRGICVPKGTPVERIEILEKAFLQIISDPVIQKQAFDQGLVPLVMGREELREYIAEKTVEYTELMRLVSQ